MLERTYSVCLKLYLDIYVGSSLGLDKKGLNLQLVYCELESLPEETH